MKCTIYQNGTPSVWNDTLLGTFDLTPVCGNDFCDQCGDCLECSGGDPCWYNAYGDHLWVHYVDSLDEKNHFVESRGGLNRGAPNVENAI